jgi:nucleoside-diphosphate-sugar epimerase
MNEILVVGGAGYVGGAIVDILLNDGNFRKTIPGYASYNVTVYDNLLYEDSYRKNVSFVYGDIRDKEKLLPLLKKSNSVIWLAALVGDGACQINPGLTKQINEDTVAWLANNYDGRIIFMSTCSVYGAQDKELDETSPTNPLSAYASTKLNAEKLLENKNSLIFRLGTLFGVGDQFSRIRLDLVVNILTVKAHTLGKIDVFGGEQFRPLLHVKDVAQAVTDNLYGPAQGIFNLHKQNVRIIDLAYQVRNHFPDLEIQQTDLPFQDTRNYRVSSDKAKQYLKFNPTYSIDWGIEELKYLIETKRIKDLNSSRYSNQAYLTKINYEKEN